MAGDSTKGMQKQDLTVLVAVAIRCSTGFGGLRCAGVSENQGISMEVQIIESLFLDSNINFVRKLRRFMGISVAVAACEVSVWGFRLLCCVALGPKNHL